MLAVVAVGIVVLIGGLLGFRSGLIRRAVELVGLLASILVAARLAAGATPQVVARTGLAEGPALIVAFVVLVLIGLLLARLAAWLISRTIRLTILGWIDRLGGALAGAAIGWLLCSVFLVALTQTPGGEALAADARRRPLLRAVIGTAPALYLRLRDLWADHGDEIWERVVRALREEQTAGRAPSRGPAREPGGERA